MDSTALSMSAELRDELAGNNRVRIVDPATVPARFHHLRAMGRSAAHCFDSFQDEKSDSLALRIGAGVHAILFNKPFEIWDRPAKKGKGKAPRNGGDWEDFKKLHWDKVILSAKERDRAQAIASAVRMHSKASRLLFGPGVIHEQTIEWTQLGRTRRSTPDARGPKHLVELKTTKCAEPGKFVRDGSFRAYHAQLADQFAAIEAETGTAPERVYIVAVESTRPYPVQVFPLTPNALEQGARLCRLWLERLIICEATRCAEFPFGHWPGYCAEETPFDVVDPDAMDLVFGDEDSDGEASTTREDG